MNEFAKDLLSRLDALQAEMQLLREENAQLRAKLDEKQKPKPKRKAQPDKDKATRPVTEEEFHDIIAAMKTGSTIFQATPRTAALLTVQANTGLRISDLANKLRMRDIVTEGGRRRLNIQEQKTGKWRRFTIHDSVYAFLSDYCIQNNIGPDQIIFDVKPRAVQRQLAIVVDWLGLDGKISTHSFRKFYATRIYVNSGYNVALVQELLQHASAATTSRYIKFSSKELDEAINDNVIL